jgi:hypothetical protein
MINITAIGFATAIMEQGKEYYNIFICPISPGQPHSILLDSLPVRDTMNTFQFESIIIQGQSSNFS